MANSIAVLSTGAIGSSVGADLTTAGYDPLLIDQWPAHVASMKANGLRVVMPGEAVTTRVRAMDICELVSLRSKFDIVLLTAKSYDTLWLVELIKPYLKPEGYLVSIQNSLNDEWIAPSIGYQRDVGCVVELSAEVFEPGLVKRNTDRQHTWFAVGELHGRITPRAREVAEMLSATGMAEVTPNIWGAKWSKLVVNSMTMAVSSTLGMHSWELTEDRSLFRLCIDLGREALEVGNALGYRMEPLFGVTADDFLRSTDEVLEKNLLALLGAVGRQARSAMQQDHLKGRRSELPYLNGLIVQKGRLAGVPTPFNEGIVAVAGLLDRGVRKPDRANIDLLRTHHLLGD